MKLLSSLLLVHGALAFNLYGRTVSREQRNTLVKRDIESEAFNEIREFMEFERYLEVSMSVSMSMSYPMAPGSGSGGKGSGSGGNGSPSSKSPSAPTPTPVTVSPTPSPSTITASPSKSPSLAPSPLTSSPTSSVTEAPSSDLIELSLFECSDQGVVVPAGTPAAVTTPVSLAVLYEAESMADTTDAFLSDLESALYSIALIAALGCDGTQRRELQQVTRRQLTVSTTEVGPCNVTESVDNTCFVLETNIVFDINDDVDPDYASFLAYTALQSAMTNYTGDEIDTVVRLTYLAPIPIEPSPATPPVTRSSKKFSPLAIGACSAMVAGGALVLYVWVHNRRTRNKRHVELIEDKSLSPVSFFSAERDPYDDA